MSQLAGTLLILLSLVQDTGDVRARLESETAAAAIGEPQVWNLVIDHPTGIDVRVALEGPLVDDSWVILQDARRITLEDPSKFGRGLTRVRWTVMSLEPGARELPSIPLEWDDGSQRRTLSAEAGSVEVHAELAEGEDAPRPALSFRPPPDDVEPLSLQRFGLAAVLLIFVGALLITWRLRGRRTQQEHDELAPAERLAALQAEDASDPRAACFEVTALLRRAVDERLGCERSGLTDTEWFEAVAAETGLSTESKALLENLLTEGERIKYGGHEPTPFALKEIFEGARGVLQSEAAA